MPSAAATWIYKNRIRVTLCWNPLIDATGCPAWSLCFPNGETMMKRTIAQLDPLDEILDAIVKAVGPRVPEMAHFTVIVHPHSPGGFDEQVAGFTKALGTQPEIR